MCHTLYLDTSILQFGIAAFASRCDGYGEIGWCTSACPAVHQGQGQVFTLRTSAKVALSCDALFLVCYPEKISSSINEDMYREIICQLPAPALFRPGTKIAIDNDWSALRFGPREAVGH